MDADNRDLEDEVFLWKAVLQERPPAHDAELLGALESLTAVGELPTSLLTETKIGQVVGEIARTAKGDDVREAAKFLVDTWRAQHRQKRSAEREGTAGRQVPRVAPGAPRPSYGISPEVPTPHGRRIPEVFKPQSSQEASGLAPGDVAQKKRRIEEQRKAPDFGFAAPRFDCDDSRITRSASSFAAPRLEFDDSRTTRSASSCFDTPIPPAEGARLQVQEKITEALRKAAARGVAVRSEEALGRLGQRIEVALFVQLRLPGRDADYKSQARSIIFNLKDPLNQSFGRIVLSGRLAPERLPTLSAEDMASQEKIEERARVRKEGAEELELDWALRHGHLQISGTFTCGKCKGNKTTYYQLQTRSSDEPMTTSVQCLSCKNRWKFC